MNGLKKWIFEHKWIASMTGLLYGPVFHLSAKVFAASQGDTFEPPESTIVDNYIKMGVIGYFNNYYWLNILGKAKDASLLNYIKATIGASLDIIGTFGNYPELARNGRKILLKNTQFLGSEEEIRTEAEYAILKGELGRAMTLYTEYLEQKKERKKTIDDIFNQPVTNAIIRAKSRIRGNNYDVLEEAIVDWQDDRERLFQETWPRILKRYNTLEMHIIYAMFLSLDEREEANEAWKRIESSKGREKITNSRNEVYELDLEHFREVIVIKKGKELKEENTILQEIQRQLGREIVVTPLAYYEEDGKQVFITKRRRGQNGQEFLGTASQTEKEAYCTSVLSKIAKVHGLNISAQEYNPIEEIKRRYIARLGTNRNAKLFMEEYKLFHARYNNGERCLCHGDLYPSNTLEDGTLLDFEKVQKASPWLDLETFLGAPELENTNTKEALRLYGEERPLDFKDRFFYQVHTSLCQTGSFSEKSPDTAKYFRRRTKEFLEIQGEENLKKIIETYSRNL